MVEAWLDAVNRTDAAQVEALTAEQVEIVGPRGSGHMDRAVVSEWMARAGFSSRVRRWYCGGDGSVVVEQAARWVDPSTGTELGRAVVASTFVVGGGRVVRFARHDAGLDAALWSAGLTGENEVVERGAHGTTGRQGTC